MGGQVITNAQESELSSEAVGLMIAALVLVLTFGTLVAAGLPIVTALFGLGISSAAVGLLAAVMDVPDWSTAVASMIGLGVGIDYALLILTRHRAALAAGLEPRAAAVEAVSTAGHSVLVAGTTVVISLLGLFLMGLSYLQGVALSASFAVLVTMAASVTLLPALLGFAGRRIDRLRIPGTARAAAADPDTTPAARWSRGVQRRPWAAAIAAAAVLLVLATPFLGLRLGFPDAGNDRAATTTRQAYDLVSKGFGAGANGPLLLAAELRGPGDRAELDALAVRLREEPGIAAVGKPTINAAGDTAVLMATPTTSPQSTGDRGPDPPPALRRPARRGPAGQRRRHDRLVRRPGRRHPGPPAAVHRRRRDPLDHAADRHVPLRHGGAQGRRDEPAVDRRRLRRRGLPRRGRLGRPARRDRHADAGAAVHPRDHVRDPVRALDGLRGVPAQPRARGVPAAAAAPRAP